MADNCLLASNPDQLDTNGDGVGDACEMCGAARLVADIAPGNESSRAFPLAAVDGKLFFRSYHPAIGSRLWVHDSQNSSVGATQLDTTIWRDASSLTALDAQLYFDSDDGVHGSELWVYHPSAPDATPALVADINPGLKYSEPYNLISDGSKLYFSADDGVHGEELWEYDPACR